MNGAGRMRIFKICFFVTFLIPLVIFPQQARDAQLKKEGKKLKKANSEEIVGGVIDVNDLHVGFLNNGRFCPPIEFIPELPNGQIDGFGYLKRLDLWIGIPDGPWAPQALDSEKGEYASVGPTVTGTKFTGYRDRWGDNIVIAGETQWSSILGTRGVYYTDELTYGEAYRSSGEFDFIMAPNSRFPQTFPQDPLTGVRIWPGKWGVDPYSGEKKEGIFLGDQDIYVAFDDRAGSEMPVSENSLYDFYRQNGYPIGAEVHAQIVGFAEGLISNMVIYDLEIINTSQWDYQDVYLGIFYQSDNPVSNQHYVYNYFYSWERTGYVRKVATEPDTVVPLNLSYNYDSAVGAGFKYFGVQLLKTPLARKDGIDNDFDGVIDEDEGEQLGLAGWHFINIDGLVGYQDTKELEYKILSGDTSGISEDLIGKKLFFYGSGSNLDPNFDDPWTIRLRYAGSVPGAVYEIYDLLSCGPIDWQSGDTLHFVFGILAADDFQNLVNSGILAKQIVENNYNRSLSPTPPKVKAVPGGGKVTLYWDDSSEKSIDYITGYWDFEGYKIYRTTVDPQNNDWGEKILDDDGKLIGFVPVARCDLDNGIKGYEQVYPYQKLGDDTGLFHSWTDTSVVNGVTYWYSVCAYDHGILDDRKLNPQNFPISPMKESPKGSDPEIAPNLVKVVPGKIAADYEIPQIEVTSLGASAGNGPIKVTVLDPEQVTGHDYLMVFEDTTYGYAVYDLFDETADSLIFAKVTMTNGEEGPIFDGLQLTVKRYEDMEVLNEKTFWYNRETGEKSSCTWSIFGGKINWDPYPYEYDIIFTDTMDTSYYMKKTAPFLIWNTVLNQRAHWDIFMNSETDTTDSLKSTWSSGDIIYIWDTFNEQNKFTLRIIIRERTIFTYQGMLNIPPQPGDVAHITLKRPFVTGDKFRISTTALSPKKNHSFKEKRVKAVPNPLIVRAGWELNSNEGEIQFINLPAKCAIHIFTSTGERVQVIHHDDPFTDYEFWDLLNFSNLKVSYGLYLFYVETPDGKADKGKFVILH